MTPSGIDLGAQFPQGLRRDVIGGAIGAIDHDLEAVEAQMLGKGDLGELDVAAAGVVDAPGAADQLRLGELRAVLEPLLDRPLVIVAELVAVGPEQLDAVVRERIVRGGDHHAEIGAHRARQHRHRRRRHRPQQHHVHADAGEAGDHRRFHHVAGQPRVLADDHAMAVVAAQEMRAGGLADAKRRLGRHRLDVGGPADAVGAEEFACHGARFSAFSRSSARSLRGSDGAQVAIRNSRVPPTSATVPG